MHPYSFTEQQRPVIAGSAAVTMSYVEVPRHASKQVEKVGTLLADPPDAL